MIAQLSGGAIIGPAAAVVGLVILAVFGRSARRRDDATAAWDRLARDARRADKLRRLP